MGWEGIAAFSGIREPLARVEEFLQESLVEDEGARELGRHLLLGKGKRVRPALVLLGASLRGDLPEGAVPLAAAVEMIHLATLVHDDIIDRAPLRRGVATIHTRWSEHASVLMGDFLFAKAFSLLAATGSNRIVRYMAAVVYEMCSGEIEQNLNLHVPRDQTEERYLERIGKKTARFVAESLRVGGILAGADAAEEQALYDFGYQVGLGFQIMDDLLDVVGSQKLGKASGSDLRTGVITLPVIHALHASPEGGRLLELCEREHLEPGEVAEAGAILRHSSSLQYTQKLADKLMTQAQARLTALPEGLTRESLGALVKFLRHRRY